MKYWTLIVITCFSLKAQEINTDLNHQFQVKNNIHFNFGFSMAMKKYNIRFTDFEGDEFEYLNRARFLSARIQPAYKIKIKKVEIVIATGFLTNFKLRETLTVQGRDEFTLFYNPINFSDIYPNGMLNSASTINIAFDFWEWYTLNVFADYIQNISTFRVQNITWTLRKVSLGAGFGIKI